MPPAAEKSAEAIFSAKVKVTRSSTLVSFERQSLVETPSMHAIYEVFISNILNVIAKVKVDNRQTDGKTEQNQYAPDLSMWGHKNDLLSEQPSLYRYI